MKIDESASPTTGVVQAIHRHAVAMWKDDRLGLVIGLLAFLKICMPFLVHEDWGFHRDELLYLAMGDHLAWGYLEVPPMIVWGGRRGQSTVRHMGRGGSSVSGAGRGLVSVADSEDGCRYGRRPVG